MSWSFKIAIAVDCIAVVVALYFIITDSMRASSSDNGSLSMVTIGMCLWIALCYFLHSGGYPRLGNTLAWVPAVPLLGYGILMLLFLILKPDFK